MQTFGFHTMLVTHLTILTKWIQHLVLKPWTVITGEQEIGKKRKPMKRFLKASNTIVIRFLGRALGA